MKPWTSVQDVKEKVRKEWDRGALATAFWSGSGIEFPYRISLRGPSSSEWSDRFDEARSWIASLEALPLEWRDLNHPRLGHNRVPTAAVWADIHELLGFVGKKKEAERYRALAETVAAGFPALTGWVADHPFVVLEVGEAWPPLLTFLDWMVHHPRPGVYLRQVDLPGVHTKFLEARKALLTALLDLVLPADAIDPAQTGAGRFAERYGLLSKPRLVRFRHLDPRNSGPRDQTWRLEDWARWASPCPRVFITENETNFLAFPDQADSMVVFGAGYGFDGWETIGWTSQVEAFYWGDLDTHGFAILDQLRSVWPGVRSFLMDEATLLAHREWWGEEPKPVDRQLSRLTDDERRVYEGLAAHTWSHKLRLEQEFIGYRWLEVRLAEVLSGVQLLGP